MSMLEKLDELSANVSNLRLAIDAERSRSLDRITELEAQLAAAQKDVERYRKPLEFILKVFEPCKADYIFSKRLALTNARIAITEVAKEQP